MTGRLFVFFAPIATAAGLLVMPVLPAFAAPTPSPTPSPTPPVLSVLISGEGLTDPLRLASDRHKQQQAAVRSEVDWLAGKPGVSDAPPPEELGPKYTVVLAVDGEPTDQYEVYPMAGGGPRVFRPAAQPDGRTVTEAWFYGRLSMPTTLLGAGVPLQGVITDPGGGGGGAPTESEAPDLQGMLGDWTKFMSLNGLIVLVVAAGVFSLAYILRQRI